MKTIGKKTMVKAFDLFKKEAERWYRIVRKFSIPDTEPKRTNQRTMRLTFDNKRKSIKSKLVYLYGAQRGTDTFESIERKLAAFIKKKPRKLKQRDARFNPRDRFTEKDSILITYPDSILEDRATLKSLKKFLDKHLKGIINSIHILPFYPFSSDRGFSVKNYKKVKKEFGSWDDVRNLEENFKLMFDGVFNHISRKSRWFRQFLRANPLYQNHFIAFGKKSDISSEDMKKIVRPRTSELLSEFKTKQGKIYVWTTFSRDQVDLNFKEPRVLLRILDVLFRYIRNGASLVRIDAANYFWKELGTSCSNLKQTHVIIQLLRDILDIAAPSVSIVTETNIIHSLNKSYFGNGRNEAQMVYNFTLPPLVLYSFYKGSVKYLSKWASRLENISDHCTWFNFLASHDGIGLTPAKRILPKKEVAFLIKQAKKHGSLVQNKTQAGRLIPYELNITWWNAINDDKKEELKGLKLKRYLASRAIALSLKGVPGIYIHSLFGTKNDSEAVTKSKVNRDINRKNLVLKKLEKEIESDSLTSRVFDGLTNLIKIRTACSAFHPQSEQKILMENESVFSVLRTSISGEEKILALINVTDRYVDFTVNCRKLKLNSKSLIDLVSRRKILPADRRISVNEFDIRLGPYDIMWISSKYLK